MNTMRTIVIGLSVLLVASFAFAGGGSEESGEMIAQGPWAWVIDAGDFPQVDALAVSGDVITAGSSTVFPAAEYLAAQFQDEGYRGTITIDSIGSGGGFERFTGGETDVSNASRGIKASEVEAARAIGREPIEFRIGTDALAVVVNPANTWVADVTLEEIAAIMVADRWSDVNSAWPNEPVLKFIPGTDSGTFDYFVEEVFDKAAEPLLESANLQLSENDNILVQGIEGSPFAIGFFGYAYYADAGDALKILNIEGIEATTANVDNGSYRLARPLFMYSDAGILRDKPQVAAWLAYLLNNAREGMLGVGYFEAPVAAIDAGKRAWLDAVGDQY